MAQRSVNITLNNNTPYTLSFCAEGLCDGGWTNVTGGPAAPSGYLPATIGGNSTIQWGAADVNILTGTEGWVKYTCGQEYEPPDSNISAPTSELIWIHWDNPYIPAPDGSTVPFEAYSSLTDVAIPCGSGAWPPFGTVPGNKLVTRVTYYVDNGTGPLGIQLGDAGAIVWDSIFAWPMIVYEVNEDVNLTFTVQLSQIGSVGQIIAKVYSGRNGLRALATQAKQPSLRKLFLM